MLSEKRTECGCGEGVWKLKKPQATLLRTVIHDTRDPHQAAENQQEFIPSDRSTRSAQSKLVPRCESNLRISFSLQI